MKCPNCKTRIDIEVSPSEGFTSGNSPIKECNECRQVWRVVPDGNGGTRIDVVKQGDRSLFVE